MVAHYLKQLLEVSHLTIHCGRIYGKSANETLVRQGQGKQGHANRLFHDMMSRVFFFEEIELEHLTGRRKSGKTPLRRRVHFMYVVMIKSREELPSTQE